MEAYNLRQANERKIWLVRDGIIKPECLNYINGTISTYNNHQCIYILSRSSRGIHIGFSTTLATNYDMYIKGTLGAYLTVSEPISGSGYDYLTSYVAGNFVQKRTATAASADNSINNPPTLLEWTKQNIGGVEGYTGLGVSLISITSYIRVANREIILWFDDDCSIKLERK